MYMLWPLQPSPPHKYKLKAQGFFYLSELFPLSPTLNFYYVHLLFVDELLAYSMTPPQHFPGSHLSTLSLSLIKLRTICVRVYIYIYRISEETTPSVPHSHYTYIIFHLLLPSSLSSPVSIDLVEVFSFFVSYLYIFVFSIFHKAYEILARFNLRAVLKV